MQQDVEQQNLNSKIKWNVRGAIQKPEIMPLHKKKKRYGASSTCTEVTISAVIRRKIDVSNQSLQYFAIQGLTQSYTDCIYNAISTSQFSAELGP